MDIPKNVLFENNGSKNLLVSFGGIRQGLGMPVFEFYKSLTGIECDKCFLKDNSQAWYFNGLGDKSNSIHDILQYLEELTSKERYENVCFLGNSMGGYAAILFGVLLNVDEIVAFSPQTFIDRWNRFVHKDERWPQQIKDVHQNKNGYPKFYNLKKVLKKQKYKGVIRIFYSKNDALDSIHSERLKAFATVKLHSYDSGNHNLVRVLKESGDLNKILKKLFI